MQLAAEYNNGTVSGDSGLKTAGLPATGRSDVGSQADPLIATCRLRISGSFQPDQRERPEGRCERRGPTGEAGGAACPHVGGIWTGSNNHDGRKASEDTADLVGGSARDVTAVRPGRATRMGTATTR